MLKQLRINLLLEKAKRTLAELLEQQNNFQKRKADIEKRFTDAGTTPDADITAIENDLTLLESEVAAADSEKKIKDVESDITRFENELKEIAKETPPIDIGAKGQNDEGVRNMEKKSITDVYTLRARLAPLTERTEIKDWLGQLRAYGKGEARAITGAELNIPQLVLEPLREIIAKYSKLMKYVNMKSLKGKARQPIVGTVPEAVWMEMSGILNELEFGFNAVEADAYKVGGFIPVPNSLLSDSDINLLLEITDILGKSLAYAVDKAIMYGGGIKQPLGIVPRLISAAAPRDFGKDAPAYTDLSSSHVKCLSSASLTATEIFAELAAGLGTARSKYAAGNKFWAMSESTFMKLQTMLITINAAGAIASAAAMTMPVIGGDVVLLDFMPDDVIAGGFGELYLLAEREGGSISRSEHAQFIQDNTTFKGTARYDGLPVIGEGFAMFILAASSGAASVSFAADNANDDAYLTALTVKNGANNITISPAFDKDILSYTASVASSVSAVTVSGTARQYGEVASIKVGDAAATNGSCALSAGDNTITITAKYGTSKRTYKIVITKAS